MSQQYEYPAPVRLAIGHVGGDLRLLGGQHSVLRIEGRDEDEVIAEGDLIRVTAGDDMTIYLPPETPVTIESVHGDLNARNLTGSVELGTAHGDVMVAHLSGNFTAGSIDGDGSISQIGGSLKLEHVNGDLRAQQMGGAVIVNNVRGDASLSQLGGAVTLDTVSGDLRVDQVGGPVDVRKVQGDAKVERCGGAITLGLVSGDLRAQHVQAISVEQVMGDASLTAVIAGGQEYRLNATGDINVTVLGPCNARFVAEAEDGEIHTTLPLAVEKGKRQHLVGVIGQPEAAVILVSHHGDINLGGGMHSHFSGKFGPADWGFDFQAEVVNRLAPHLDRVAKMAHEHVNAAMERAEAEMREAMRRAAEQSGAPREHRHGHEHDWGHKAGKWGSDRWHWYMDQMGQQPPTPEPPNPPEPPRYGPPPFNAQPPVQPEPPAYQEPSVQPRDEMSERTILEMVRAGSITPDEGVRLLEALPGHQPRRPNDR